MTAKTKKLNIWLVSISVILLSATLVLFPLAKTFGWFSLTNNQIKPKPVPVQPFSVTVNAWFDSNGNGAQDTGEEQSTQSAFAVDVTNPAAPNYYKKLRVNVTYSGEEDAAMRVHVVHLWRQGNDSNPSIPSRANIAFDYDNTSFIDSSKSSNCYYYCNTTAYNNAGANTIAQQAAYVLTPALAVKTFSVITGSNQTTIYDQGLQLDIFIKAELAQPNRTEQLWGTTLPAPPKPTTP